MSRNEPLSGRIIAISISESPDMAVLGLAQEHLDDAMAEIARYLLAMEASLVYGGDLRPKGFTELLIELVIRHRRSSDAPDGRVGFTNYFPWPVHVSLSPEEVKQRCEAVEGLAEVVFLTVDGRAMSFDERQRLTARQPTQDEWAEGLTAMRNLVTTVSHVRVVMGGKVADFQGRMPGVAEESLAALRAAQPLFLLGGFGGCARDIAEELGLAPASGQRRAWPRRDEFANFTTEDMHNWLSVEENVTLATTPHVEQAVTLILRGLLRGQDKSRP